MCGIYGYLDFNKSSMPEPLLTLMGDSIEHRGPDESGIYIDEGVALGNKRLSIIDVKEGHQPVISDDGSIIVVQNGEIYNHIELALELKEDGYPCKTKSDTEVILRLYERDGIKCLSKLNGMFGIAIYDRNEESLYLCRDRLGVKPVYFHCEDERLLFASEIKAILAAGIKPEIELNALNLFLTYNYVPPPYTMFKNIKHVQPGSYICIKGNKMVEHRWWDITNAKEDHNATESEWIDHFNSILEDAVKLRMRSDVPFGAFLSGGVDSSSVVGLMSQSTSEKVKTFSIGFDDKRFDESEYALMAAEKFSCDHLSRQVDENIIDLWPDVIFYCDQPHGDVSFLPTYIVSELASSKVKVVLTGDGGDELFAGYDKYKTFFSDDGMLKEGAEMFRDSYYKNISLFDEVAREKLLSPKVLKNIDADLPYQIVTKIFDDTKHFDYLNQALLIDTLLLLPGNNLVKPDRMGMAHSLEARTPFLDYRMVELAFSMPGTLKLKGGVTKYIFKKAVASLIGEELAYRKKQMFTVPIGEWFKDKLSMQVREMLLDDKSYTNQYFNKEYVSDLVNNHINNIENNTREIRAMLAVELWCRKFLN